MVRRFAYGESSLVVHVVTRHHGRRALLAKGAYRTTSRYFGTLDLFDSLELCWHEGSGETLGLVSEARILERRRPLSRDLRRFQAGLAVLELARLVAVEGHGDAHVFDVAETFLDVLAVGAASPEVALPAHDLALLGAVGLAPALEHCAACGRVPGPAREPHVPFSRGAGGRLCDRCAGEAAASGRRVTALPLNVLRLATSLMRTPARNLARVTLPPTLAAEVGRFVKGFLEYHLETRLRRRPVG